MGVPIGWPLSSWRMSARTPGASSRAAWMGATRGMVSRLLLHLDDDLGVVELALLGAHRRQGAARRRRQRW